MDRGTKSRWLERAEESELVNRLLELDFNVVGRRYETHEKDFGDGQVATMECGNLELRRGEQVVRIYQSRFSDTANVDVDPSQRVGDASHPEDLKAAILPQEYRTNG
jgi:hypothetical protein